MLARPKFLRTVRVSMVTRIPIISPVLITLCLTELVQVAVREEWINKTRHVLSVIIIRNVDHATRQVDESLVYTLTGLAADHEIGHFDVSDPIYFKIFIENSLLLLHLAPFVQFLLVLLSVFAQICFIRK